MKKYAFIPNIWITFSYGSKLYVGRTLLINDEEMISCIAEDGTNGELMFSWVKNPVKLNFGLTKQKVMSNTLKQESIKTGNNPIIPNKKSFPVLLNLN